MQTERCVQKEESVSTRAEHGTLYPPIRTLSGMVATVCIQVQISNGKGSVQQNEDCRGFEGQANVQSHIGH